MTEKLTWEEIKKRYPDEYVVLIDPEVDETDTVLAGTVVDHGKDKHEMYQVLGKLNPKDGGCLWTGKVHGRIRVLTPEEQP